MVERVKAGRAYVYRPRLTAEDARAQALGQVLESFFGGSQEALLAQLGKSTSIRRAAAATGIAPPSGSAAKDERRTDIVLGRAGGTD